MASPPGIGPISRRQILQNNMREARSHAYGRNAALPQTYLWFYQTVRINAAHWLLTVLLAIFAWLSYQPDPRAGDTLQSVRLLAPGTWLYTTQNSEGGGTVPTVHRYYLRNADGASVQQLYGDFSFLTGSGSLSAIAVDGATVRIDYSGRVYSIEQHAGRDFLTYSLREI
ncbi:hypothetical protein PF050_08365 [Kosakonia pseudosacchari]|uniref:hypothetical protein n=1 Tax=Kosakonia pseudosacchari TaxID=1646340 RepID=UPI0022F13B4B|nr:hypothetical protein [Kosakonia pseudosacchari]WBU50911.1 hypothetical protein PF050_08365 [Kosakonia pseudosacchari]